LDASAATLTGDFTLNGGDGAGDTLILDDGQADSTLGLTADSDFENNMSGFERVHIKATGQQAATTVDLSKLDDISYVLSYGGGSAVTINKMASGGTVVLADENTSQGGTTVSLTDAAGKADILNLETNGAAAPSPFGKVTAAGIETVNLNTVTGGNAAEHTLTLTADAATSIVVTGEAAVALTLTGSTKVTSIDGSAMSAGLNVTSLNTSSATKITGGNGDDLLVAATGTTADILIGGAGDDILVANAGLSTLTGGEGADSFLVSVASSNINSYATITDFAAGDLLDYDTNLDGFVNTQAGTGLASTAGFSDYVNDAISAAVVGEAAWFQYGGNTYVVADVGVADTLTFTTGEDYIVKLTGLVNLSNASFNTQVDTISL
jgi:S-layer protein